MNDMNTNKQTNTNLSTDKKNMNKINKNTKKLHEHK